VSNRFYSATRDGTPSGAPRPPAAPAAHSVGSIRLSEASDGGVRSVSSSPPRFLKTALSLAVLCMTALLLVTRGMTDEATVSLQGDMPRYLMNGAFFYDFARDLPLQHPIDYAYRYYARYPALSLGHHPLLLGIAEAPFYAAFGISVFSGRLTVVFFLLLGLAAWYALVTRLYNQPVAFFAAVLLVTTPYIVDQSRVVLSEIPALALVLVAAYCLCRYSDTSRSSAVYAFALAAVSSVYAKHLAVFMFPVYLLYFVIRNGVRALFTRQVVIATAVMVGLVLPLIPITLEFSRANVAWVASARAASRFGLPNLLYYIKVLWTHHLTLPLLALSIVSLFLSIYRRDKRAVLPVLWIVLFYLQITYTRAHEPRYAIYWIPPFCLLAAAAYALLPGRSGKVLGATVLTLTVVYQLVAVSHLEPVFAGGYEEAAEYVVQHRKGETVLFSGNVDSGFFVFFVRKHDAGRDMVVLRADKMLVTSSLSRIIATQLTTPAQIYAMLHEFGTAYVVLEDAPYESPPLELLRQLLKTEHFALRKRIHMRSNSDKLRGVDLLIYEYLDYTPGQPGAVLRMRLPLIGGNVATRFGDLLGDEEDTQR
jgi:Dolichyl-phosphate-mannose-protein mannosyltransferase